MQLLHQLCAASGLHGICEARVHQRSGKYGMTHGVRHASVYVCVCVCMPGLSYTSLWVLWGTAHGLCRCDIDVSVV